MYTILYYRTPVLYFGIISLISVLFSNSDYGCKQVY